LILTLVQQRHLEHALRLSELSTCKQQHGAVVAKGKRVLSVGVNRNRNNPCNVSNPKVNSALHAERAALKTLEFTDVDFSRVTLYVARSENRLSRPCELCWKYIEHLGVGQVIWTPW